MSLYRREGEGSDAGRFQAFPCDRVTARSRKSIGDAICRRKSALGASEGPRWLWSRGRQIRPTPPRTRTTQSTTACLPSRVGGVRIRLQAPRRDRTPIHRQQIRGHRLGRIQVGSALEPEGLRVGTSIKLWTQKSRPRFAWRALYAWSARPDRTGVRVVACGASYELLAHRSQFAHTLAMWCDR